MFVRCSSTDCGREVPRNGMDRCEPLFGKRNKERMFEIKLVVCVSVCVHSGGVLSCYHGFPLLYFNSAHIQSTVRVIIIMIIGIGIPVFQPVELPSCVEQKKIKKIK
ncbi:unnamed protein product [Tuber aestivum]|uniref:Uncharacterized protein n=1 Tax=Tuber aestivum TaxID=59557 RepID=A0A292PSH4_9PEZI|nr:unnamed protein product [Tuber aestivum]